MHDFSVELWKESNLSDAEMGNLTSGLAGALKEVADLDYILVGPLKERMKKVKYLTAVYGYIERFETKKKESDTSQHLFGKFGKMAKSLFGQYPPADQVEMCNQLRDKHLDFLNQIRLELELHYTFIYVDKEKFETMATHLKNKYKPLYDLNSAAESVYMNIASVLRWPLKDTNEQNFVTSLSEVAQKAKAQERKSNASAT
jgi:hypothetical protein